MKIKAAVARAHGAPLAIEGLELDEPRKGELLVRLVASGVAQVDRDAIAGRLAFPLPFVPGSEAAGIVERVGPGVAAPAPGDSVLVAYSACTAGDTRDRRQFEALNLSGQRSDGASGLQAGDGPVHGFFFGQSSFATHLLCRAADAVPVTATVPLELAAALGGEFLTGSAPILRAALGADDVVVITGADAVGLAACMIARATGIGTIVLADPDEGRRKLGLELGATLAVPADSGLAAVVKSFKAEGARLALETSGHEEALQACLASLGDGGRCAIVHGATRQPADTTDVRIEIAERDLDARELVPRLVALLQQGSLPLERLISFFDFEHVNDALDALASGAVAKPVLRFSLGAFGALDRARNEGAAFEEAGGAPSSEPVAGDAEPAADAPETAPVVSA